MGAVLVSVDLDDKGFSAKISGIRRQSKQLQDSMKDIEHQTVNSMQASSAAIRVLEGGMTGNIRAAERFISMMPGVGKALQAAFPLVGGIALAGVFVRIGEEAYKTIHTIEQLRNVTREGLLSLTESSMKGVDSLRVQNDKLEQSIAMMEHQPVNGMALALDESRVKADDLAISLNKDYTAFKKLLDEGKVGILGQLMGKGSGKDVQAGVNDRLANIRTLGIQQQDQMEDGNTAGAADTLAKLKAAQAEARSWERQQVAMRQGKRASPNGDMLPYSSFYGDQGQNIDTLQGFGTVVRSQQDTQKEQERNSTDVETQKKLEAANRAREAMQKASAVMLKQYELDESQQNAFNKMTTNEEIRFWNDRLAAFRKGSEQYLQVQRKIYEEIASRPDLTKENKRNQAQAGKSTVEGNDLLANAQKALQTVNRDDMERAAKSLQKYYEIVDEGTASKMKEAAAFREASIAIGLQDGTISKLAAAQALAALHADDHAAALKEVNKELADQIALIKSDPRISDGDKADSIRNAQATAGNRTDALNGSYQVTSQQDAANMESNTISGAAQKSLNEMTQSFVNMADNLKNVIPSLIEGMNDNIVKIITGQGKKGDIGRTFLQAGQGLLKTGIQGAEGMALSALHLGGHGAGGKPDGSKGNRLFVSALIEGEKMAAAAGASGVPLPGGIAGSALGHIPGLSGGFFQPFIQSAVQGFAQASGGSTGGQTDSSSGGAGGPQSQSSIWGKFLGAALPSLIGSFAGGGDFMANHPMLVGERGPELLMPRMSGRIIPNHELGAGGGGGGPHYHFHIQGNQDPMAVRAAIMSAAPAISAHTLQAQHSMAKRTPSGR